MLNIIVVPLKDIVANHFSLLFLHDAFSKVVNEGEEGDDDVQFDIVGQERLTPDIASLDDSPGEEPKYCEGKDPVEYLDLVDHVGE